jgi:hypothetical protein
MKIEMKIEVPKYSKETGITYKWENGFELQTNIHSGIITISGNKEGLISLANHLLNLSQEEIPSGFHLHFDDSNSLEEGSSELIIMKS